jgi:hypothetical protein
MKYTPASPPRVSHVRRYSVKVGGHMQALSVFSAISGLSQPVDNEPRRARSFIFFYPIKCVQCQDYDTLL